jgi:putative transposase
MAIWRRKPRHKVLIHSDQGVQYTCNDWHAFTKANNLEVSMSRRGNCHDNAVAESFFSNLKKELIRRKVYKTRDEAKADVFNYISNFSIIQNVGMVQIMGLVLKSSKSCTLRT